MRSSTTLKLAALALMLGLPWQVQAALEIRITQGVEGALPIAISPFAWQARAGAAAPQDIARIVSSDLVRSGQFKAIPEGEFPQLAQMGKPIYFKDWRGRDVDYLVVGRLIEQGPDRYQVQFQLFDTVQQRQLIGYSIPARQKDLRRAAHQVSDYIYEKLIGQRGAFNTRVAYVTTQKTTEGRQHALQIADADGYNPRTMLRSPLPLMSPAWSPDGRRVAYVSFEGKRPAVFVQEIATAQKQLISRRPGINGAPAWSPDGNRLALTLSESGNPEIYVYDLRTKALTRLTNNRAIDTEPVWMPDGRAILFTSDRSGSPQIYKVSAGGGRAERITFEGSYNADADVSPDGKKIAVVHGTQAGFRIAVMDLDSGLVRVLTRGRLDEAPTFAPNGSMIMYATEERGRGVLAAVSEDGRVHQTLVLQEGEVREPDWSPFAD